MVKKLLSLISIVLTFILTSCIIIEEAPRPEYVAPATPSESYIRE